MGMFCFQCQETAGGKGCTIRGVCGKPEEVANLQDLLIYVLKGISDIVVNGKLDVTKIAQVNHELTNSLFMTITNANFDPEAIEKQIRKMLDLRGELLNQIKVGNLHDSATFKVNTKEEMIEKSRSVGVLSIQPEDVRQSTRFANSRHR